MLPIVQIKFGSHLYGTNTPASDLDLKGVHLPPRSDILLQRIKNTESSFTKTDKAAKNSADDVDNTSFAIQRFLGLAAEGQTVAMDMLFAPEWAIIGEPHRIWHEIQANRHRLLTSKAASFVGYCRSQANKYGIRGSRVASARAALAMLDSFVESYGSQAKLAEIEGFVRAACLTNKHMSVINIPSQAGTDVQHWEVCDRKMPFTATGKSARDIMQRVVNEYGHRALAAETNQGVDWKAISHAVRIAEQAIELLNTGNITFPRPEAKFLLEIKLGKLPYAPLGEHIDDLLVRVEAAAAASALPRQPDHEWIDEFVRSVHADIVEGWVLV